MAAGMTRLTLYALITAIEEDLRKTANIYLPSSEGLRPIFGDMLFEKLIERMDVDVAGDDSSLKLEELLDYSDLGDIYQLIRQYIANLPADLVTQFDNCKTGFTNLIGIRNRVMHARPLEFDDLAQTTELCEKLKALPAHWPALSEVMDRMVVEPELVLKLTIPFERDLGGPSNNLPLPDFDETGFIGRRSTVDNVMRALNGVYPVVTIVGEGGLGKTSLALKVAYEVLDKYPSSYDAIIFVTAKTSQLTNTEILRIKGSINTSIGLFEVAASALGGQGSDPLEDLINVLSEFKVLLIIDNLETVIDGHMHALLSRIPHGSKILITTRIRLGAYEFPVQLEPMSELEGVQLLRATAKVRGCGRLVAASNKTLAGFCSRMRNNPLHIKWFVSAVQAGQRPEKVLADEKIFLQFCLSNVFSQIGDNSRRLVRTLLTLGGSYTVAELAFLTGMEHSTLLSAIQELTRTNMFFATSSPLGASFETKYELSQLARAYLSRFYPVNKEEQAQMLKIKQRLVSAGEQMMSETRTNPLSASNIHCRNRSDWVTAKGLREALSKIKLDQIDDAIALIETAKELAPDFSEVYRVEAWALARSGNLSLAYDSYEKAIALAPDLGITYHLFGGFLLRDMHDSESAADMFEKAAGICPERPEPKIDLARCRLYKRDFPAVKNLLDELESMPALGEYLERKIADLHLQYFTRYAETCFNGHEYGNCIDSLMSARTFYEGIRHPDRKMRDRLVKVMYFLSSLKSYLLGDVDRTMQVDDFSKWLREVLFKDGALVSSVNTLQRDLELINCGYVRRLHSSGAFGFIEQDNGDEIYFRMNQLSGGLASTEIHVGVRVKFDVQFDWKGRLVAMNISLQDSSGASADTA